MNEEQAEIVVGAWNRDGFGLAAPDLDGHGQPVVSQSEIRADRVLAGSVFQQESASFRHSELQVVSPFEVKFESMTNSGYGESNNGQILRLTGYAKLNINCNEPA